MQAKASVFSMSTFGAAIVAVVFAATSAHAATLGELTFTPGFNYQTVTVSTTVTGGDDTEVLQYTVKDLGGNSVATAEGAAGEQEKTITLPNAGQTYIYEVTIKNTEESKSAIYQIAASAGPYFSADATTTPHEYNGTWDAGEPTIESGYFKIDGDETVFSVTSADKPTAAQDPILVADCKAKIESYYSADSIAEGQFNAVSAIALVSNETSDAACWMVLTGGNTWSTADSGASVELGTYDIRMEVDYSGNVSTDAKVRYSVKADNASDWSVLTVNGAEWLAATNVKTVISKVCFVGKADVANFTATVSTKNLVSVNNVGYINLALALTEAKADSGYPVVLLTNVEFDPKNLPTGDYTLDKGDNEAQGKDGSYGVTDTKGNVVSIEGNTLKVEEKTLCAEIGTVFGAAGNTRYFSLAAAAAVVEDGKTIFLVADDTESEAIEVTEDIVLDLNKKVLTLNAALTFSGDASLSNGVVKGTGSISTGEGASLAVLNGSFGVVPSGTGVAISGGRFVGETAPTSVKTGFKAVQYAVPVTESGLTLNYEVVPVPPVPGPEPTEPTKLWTVAEDGSKAAVELPDTFVDGLVPGGTAEQKLTALKESAAYTGVKKWQCYVLGMNTNTSTEGPYVKGATTAVDPNKVGFSLASKDTIKALESGCEVKFKVEAYANPDFSGTAEATSPEVDWDKTAELDLPTTGAQYYKLTVFVTPKN